MKRVGYIWLLVALAFCGCTQNGKNEPEEGSSDHSKDLYLCTLLAVDSTIVSFYLAPTEYQIEHITLATYPFPDRDIKGDYVVPAKSEAEFFHMCYVKDVGTERYLCFDFETQTWYTFCFNGVGKLTKAGSKTKYTLRPIKMIVQPKDTIISL